LEPFSRIAEFCKATIGRTPTTIELMMDGTIELTFFPSLTTTEKVAFNDAIPDIVKKFFAVIVTEV